MDNEDLVSIIVPVYNAEEFINDTIKTVQDQTYKNWELIMIDDCSTDRSTEQILKYKSDKIKLIKLKKNSGAAICRNTGIKEYTLVSPMIFSDSIWGTATTSARIIGRQSSFFMTSGTRITKITAALIYHQVPFMVTVPNRL